jgi:nicotinamidase-related amidase
MSDSRNPHAGIDALLTPQDSVLLLIDHQGFQFANLHSHEPQLVVNNVVGLAKTAKLFGVPTILTTSWRSAADASSREFKASFPSKSQSIVRSSTRGRTPAWSMW